MMCMLPVYAAGERACRYVPQLHPNKGPLIDKRVLTKKKSCELFIFYYYKMLAYMHVYSSPTQFRKSSKKMCIECYIPQ